jgi:hypothetical protein
MKLLRALILPAALCVAIAVVAPAQAQETRGANTAMLSDVSGPFGGNPPILPPDTIPNTDHQSPSRFDNPVRDIFVQQFPGGTPLTTVPGTDSGPDVVLSGCIALANSLDKLMPFSGCGNVNWKVYNRALKDTKELRRALAQSVQEQRRLLAANPSPEAKALIVKRLALIERTTDALQATTTTLVYLGGAMDKAR